MVNKAPHEPIRRRFGRESDVARLTGISIKTLQRHRLLGCGFPFYRFNGKAILYDMAEIEQVILASRSAPGEMK